MKKPLRLANYLVVPSILLVLLVNQALAAPWNGIEPLKSRRADLERILGKPAGEGSDGTLRFSVAGGTAIVTFVDKKFVTTKKLRPELEGTVLLIVLQHEGSSDTPESMGLTKNRSFDHEELQGASIFRNLKDGVAYTFINGKLRTTRFTFSTDQFSRARRGR
jgi:hypothetical protein